MSESYKPPTDAGPGKKRKYLVPAIGGVAAMLLIAGTAVAVQANNAETAQRCGDAISAAQSAAAAETASAEKAATALDLATSTKGYDKASEAASLLSDVDKAKQDLAETTVGTECASRDQAAELVSLTETATTKAAALDEVAVKLSDHVTGFKVAETKRIAAEKKAADEKAAAEAAAAEAVAAEEKKVAEEKAEAAAAQSQYVPQHGAPAAPGGGYVPAPMWQAPAPYAPVQQAPYVPAQPAPAPAPAPAPVTGGGGGGWTPPPPGSGPGGGSCTQIGDHIMCPK